MIVYRKPTTQLCFLTLIMQLLWCNVWGKGALAKIDIKHAFRICPLTPEDYGLLGTFWEGLYSVELRLRLPFSLRSSVIIFNSFADAIQRILTNKHLIHYLDDFFTASEAGSPQYAANIDVIKKVFH